TLGVDRELELVGCLAANLGELSGPVSSHVRARHGARTFLALGSGRLVAGIIGSRRELRADRDDGDEQGQNGRRGRGRLEEVSAARTNEAAQTVPEEILHLCFSPRTLPHGM